MKPRYKVSRAAIELIKSFEGFRELAAQTPEGAWTIGYGHAKTARAGTRVSEAEAELLLLYDLVEVGAMVNDLVYTPLTQNQFDALICFAFNIGLDGFRRSTVLRRINEGSMLQAACSFDMWRKADFEGERIVVDALVRRRAAEKALFLKPASGWVPAPSPVLRPKLDYDVCSAVPKDKPVDLTTTLVGDAAVLTRETDAASRVNEKGGQTPPPSKLADAGDAVQARLSAIMPTAREPRSSGEGLAPPPLPPASNDQPFSTQPQTAPFPAPRPAPVEPELFEPTLTPMRPAPMPAPASWSERSASDPFFASDGPAPLAANADLFQRPIYREDETGDDALADLDLDQAKPARLKLLPLILLGLVGLAIFAGAIVWGFSATSSAGLTNPKIIGGVIGLVGVVIIGGVAYSLLSKFGDHAE